MIDKPGLTQLVGALVALAQEWRIDEISATYTLGERVMSLHVIDGRLATIEDDRGAIIKVPAEFLP